MRSNPVFIHLLRVASSFLLLAAIAIAQETTRVSVDSSGGEGNSYCSWLSMSADARFVSFASYASNLVAGDTNNQADIFVHDRTTGITERVNVDSSGAEAVDESGWPSISADGRIVAFQSRAWNLGANPGSGTMNIYIHDRSTGSTEIVSVDPSGAQGNSDSYWPSLSADGEVVAFSSYADNLVSSDTNSVYDIFVHDRATGRDERVSVDSSGAEANDMSLEPAISADGNVVAFSSFASNLVAGDTNGCQDIFVHDRTTGVTERVSVDSSGAEGDGFSSTASLSADGQIVAFRSQSDNLVAGDTNFNYDVFVHDRSTGITERISVRKNGKEGNDFSGDPSISSDGRYVAFDSLASNLVTGDTNRTFDTFIHDRSTGRNVLVSVDSSGIQGDGPSGSPSISADGQTVAFDSQAPNLVAGDTNGFGDAFVHELCSTDAAWSNYGPGFPGTNGIPTLTSVQNPVLGTTVEVDLSNSYSMPTLGVLFIGYQQTDIATSSGGDLLVVPSLVLPISFSYGFDSFTGDIPDDLTLCGVTLDVQAIESDPGAAMGVSFTQGLELVLGR